MSRYDAIDRTLVAERIAIPDGRFVDTGHRTGIAPFRESAVGESPHG